MMKATFLLFPFLCVVAVPARSQGDVEFCFERRLPLRIRISPPAEPPHSKAPAEFIPSPERIAVMTTAYWSAGGVDLHVGFLAGTSSLQQKVMRYAQEWQSAANIRFTSAAANQAEIRVTFEPGRPAWYYLGTAAVRVGKTEPTLGLGGLTDSTSDAQVRSVVLHAFGHVLGLTHSPPRGVQWNAAAVYAYFAGANDPLTKEEIDERVLSPQPGLTECGQPNPASIMLLPVPKRLTTDGVDRSWQQGLSRQDRECVAGIYPKKRK